MNLPSDFEVLSLPGLSPFAEVHSLQLELLEKRIHDQIPDTLIFCEHSSVITRGRGLQRFEGQTERAKPLESLPANTDYVEIERGGDLTWHGPGQLVLYPIVKLGPLVGNDIDQWIRFLEQVWMDAYSELGVHCKRKAGGSGVWVNGPPLMKLTSVGIALRRWVSFHGTASNLVNSLDAFYDFEPCGFKPELMTRAIAFESVPELYRGPEWRQAWESLVLKHWQAGILKRFSETT